MRPKRLTWELSRRVAVGSNDGLGADVDDAIHGASETGNMGARLSRAE